MMSTTRGIDDFDKLVICLMKKEQLLQGLFDFLDLGRKHEIKVEEDIFFLGEYQHLLFESIILSISYILIDGETKDAKKSRMRVELDKVVEKLKSDIENNKSDCNYTVCQKSATLTEIEEIRKSKAYKNAIGSIKTMRNKKVGHSENFDFSKKSLSFEQIKLAIKNIKRCYEIRQLAIHNIGNVSVSSVADYNHRNVVEALVIQHEIKNLKDEYYNTKWSIKDKRYSSLLEFWSEEIKPTYLNGE